MAMPFCQAILRFVVLPIYGHGDLTQGMYLSFHQASLGFCHIMRIIPFLSLYCFQMFE